MGPNKQLIQLAVTFLPLIGIVLTAAAAVRLNGLQKWAGMIVIPLITYAIYVPFADALSAKGSMVAAAVSMFYTLVFCIYFFALVIFAGFRWLRRNEVVDEDK